MDPTGWGLVAFVVLLSGALSYYGDVLGRKLGKKRLTVGRLRPRHTAAMMTALFGMLGSAIAIAALVLFSTPVRVMLFEGDKLRADMSLLKGQLKTYQSDLDKRQKELEDTKGQVTAEKGKVADEKAKLAGAQAEVSRLKTTAGSLKRQAEIIRNEVRDVRRQLAAIKPEFERIKIEKKRAETAVAYSNGELQRINKQNLNLMNEISGNEAKIKSLNTQINGLNKDFADLQSKYQDTVEKTRQDIEGLRQQVEDARISLENANREFDRVNAASKALISGPVAASRFQPLTFSREEELARISVRPNLNQAEARSIAFALLDQASTAANLGGASPTQSNGPFVYLPPVTDKNKQTLSEEEQIQAFIQRILNVSREQVLIANTVTNSFKGEAVPLSIRALPNPIVYKKEQIIVETIIDGALTQDQIVDAISKFAQEQLAPKAIKDGMIPAIGQANPLGEISQQDLLNLVEEIKLHQFRSRVKVVAAQDIRAGDKLKLEFRVS